MTPLVLAICLGILSHYSILIHAGSVGVNGTCDQTHNRLNSDTKQFSSDCTATTYCGPDNTCHHKGCRRDEYPFGYRLFSNTIPPRCPKGSFCPDEEDACQPLLPVGSLCQLNRDDECAPPPNHSVLAGPNNFNGSVCLNYQCMWANATLGNDCVVENTPYISYEAGTGNKFINVVSRGNCEKDLYCDSQTLKCMTTRQIGDKCDADKECESDNCTQEGVCGSLLNAPKHLPVAVYVVVGLCIVGVMVGVIVGLYVLHRRHRAEEREKRAQYWREQEQFRQNIMQMREQARGSLLSLPWQGQPSSPQSRSGPIDSGVYSPSDTSPTPMLYAASQPSGLRNGFSDNGFDDDKEEGSMEESLVMKAAPRGVGGTATRRHNPHPKRI